MNFAELMTELSKAAMDKRIDQNSKIAIDLPDNTTLEIEAVYISTSGLESFVTIKAAAKPTIN